MGAGVGLWVGAGVGLWVGAGVGAILTCAGVGGGRFTLTAAISGILRGSNPSWKVPDGTTVLDPCGVGEGFALAGKEVGAGRGVEFWKMVVGLGEGLVLAKVVPIGVAWGAAVVAAPDGAALLLREICCPPWIFCWRLVWKVPVFWLKES